MKILWLSHLIPYPPKGGVLQRSYHLLKQLSRYHDVDLLAFHQKNLMAPLVPSLQEGVETAREHLSEFCGRIEFFEIPAERTPFSKKWLAFKSLFTRYPYTLNWLLSDEFRKRLAEVVREGAYDFVHFDTISLAPFMDACPGVRKSLDHHNIESHMLLRRAGKERNLLKKFYFWQEGKRLERYEKQLCLQFDFNFTCSDLDTQRLLDISPDSRVHTIPNGVDVGYFKPSGKEEKNRNLIFIGGMSWYPNIEAVEFLHDEIWQVLQEMDSNISVDIIGSRPPTHIQRYDSERFHVHGFVDDILPIFDKALCYVCPIKDGGGTKLKILDALAMGKAIVADPVACEGINVTHGENVLFAETGAEYVEKIKSVVEDPVLRKKLERGARKLAVAEYSYDSIGRDLAGLYENHAPDHLVSRKL